MEFKLPELAVMARGVNYNPALSIVVNRLLNTRSQPEYNQLLQEATKIAIGYENVTIFEPKDYGKSSHLTGMPLWQPLELQKTGDIEAMLLESAVVNLTRTKNIVTTEIQGRDTSVDEFINNGDWQIDVKGILCDNQARWPMEQTLEFNKFMELKQSIKITHEVMNALGIYEIVVLSYELPKSPHINFQTYGFMAKSTKPLPLIINDKAQEQII